jgi:superfamily II DNA or RNA helicase
MTRNDSGGRDSTRSGSGDLKEKLRPYQFEGLQSSKDNYLDGICRQLLVSPTGTGKTVMFGTLPIFHQFRKRMLVLVHRDELATQAKEKIEFWNPQFKVGIDKGSVRCDGTERVVVASVQTIGRAVIKKVKRGNAVHNVYLPCKRLLAYNPEEFEVVTVDEAHHAVAMSYRIILRHFGFLEGEKFEKTRPGPRRLLIGLTATPKRCDGARLDQVFDKIVYDFKIEDAIMQGWLVQLRCWRIETTGIFLDGVEYRGGDYASEQLSKAVNTPARNKLVVQEWYNRALRRPTICFAVDVKHIKALTAEFKKRGVRAEGTWADDPDRKKKLTQFKNGELHVLVNCELLTEGYDESRVSCVLLARPTQSEALLKQMVGRGVRLEKGIQNLLVAMAEGYPIKKPDCLIIDFADTTKNPNVMNFAAAYGLPPNMNLRGAALAKTLKDFENFKESAQDELDIRECKDPESMEVYRAHLNTIAAKKAKAEAKRQFKEAAAALAVAQEVGDKVQSVLNDPSSSIVAKAKEVDLFEVQYAPDVKRYSDLQWHTVNDEYILKLPGDGAGQLTIGMNKLNVPFVKGQVNGTPVEWTDVCVGASYAEAFQVAEKKLRGLVAPKTWKMLDRKEKALWKFDDMTDAQYKALAPGYKVRFHIDLPRAAIKKGQASEMITKFLLEDKAKREEEAQKKAVKGGTNALPTGQDRQIIQSPLHSGRGADSPEQDLFSGAK